MIVGILQLALRFPEVHSLKEKRWILKSFLTRTRNKFNVSISEIDHHDLWQRATVAAAYVGNDRAFANELLDQLLNFSQEVKQLEVTDSQLEFL